MRHFMELQLIFCLFAFVVNFYLFGYVVLRNPFPKVNRSFILISFLCTVWNFSILFSFPDLFNFWHKMIYVSASWLGVAAFIFLRDVTYPNSHNKLILIISIPSVLLNLAVLHPDFSSYETLWFKIFLICFSAHLLITMLLGLRLLNKKRKETNNQLSKRIYNYLMITSLIAFLGGLSDNIFPGANPYEIGQLSNGIYTLMIGYIIMKTNILVLPKTYSIWKAVGGWIVFSTSVYVLVLSLHIQPEVAIVAVTLILLTSGSFSFFPAFSKLRSKLETVFFQRPVKQKKITDKFTADSLKFLDEEQVFSEFRKYCSEGASAEILAVYKMDETQKLRLISQFSGDFPVSFRLPDDQKFREKFNSIDYLRRDDFNQKNRDEWQTVTQQFFIDFKIQIGLKITGANNVRYFLFFNRDDELSDWNIPDINFLQTLSAQFILIREHLEFIRERQLMERMAIVGQMTVTLAHEIRNPLSSIKFAAKSISENNREKYKKIIVEEVDRLNRLVNDLLDYGKPIKPNIEELSVKKITENCFEKIRLVPENQNVLLISEFQTDFIQSIDRELISQVLLNLIVNSIQAMKRSGKICIREINDSTLVIEDNGPGIPESELHKIFLPFFTTKTEGSGLGLSVVRRILTSMNSTIHYDKNFKTGARFIIQFL